MIPKHYPFPAPHPLTQRAVARQLAWLQRRADEARAKAAQENVRQHAEDVRRNAPEALL